MKIYLLEYTASDGKKYYAKSGTRIDYNINHKIETTLNVSKYGKAWSSRGGLSGHLALYGNANYYTKHGFVILEIDTDKNTMERMTVEQFKAS